MALHPVISAADTARMSVSELSFFTDAPVAHAVSYRDFIRARQIETRNAEIAEYLAKRRDHNIARFFTEAADAVASMDAYS